jgi:hypothetical protein
MTSLQTPSEATNMKNSNLAAPDNTAQRALAQMDSSAGGNYQQPRIEDYGEDEVSVDDQWKIINAYFD